MAEVVDIVQVEWIMYQAEEAVQVDIILHINILMEVLRMEM